MAEGYEQLTLDREFDDFGEWVKAQPPTPWGTETVTSVTPDTEAES